VVPWRVKLLRERERRSNSRLVIASHRIAVPGKASRSGELEGRGHAEVVTQKRGGFIPPCNSLDGTRSLVSSFGSRERRDLSTSSGGRAP